MQNNLTHTFLAQDVELVGAPRPEESEDLRVHLVPARDLDRLIADGDFIQALHVAPLLWYLRHHGPR